MKFVLILAIFVAVAFAQDSSIAMDGCESENDEICSTKNEGFVCHILGNGVRIGDVKFNGACVPKG